MQGNNVIHNSKHFENCIRDFMEGYQHICMAGTEIEKLRDIQKKDPEEMCKCFRLMYINSVLIQLICINSRDAFP